MTDERIDELIAAELANAPDGGFEFCNDGCESVDGKECTWDGIDSRCKCGNRRMYWASIEDIVYPECD